MADGISGLKPGALPMRNAIIPAEQDQKLRMVAKDYEQYFLKELVKSMRSTVGKSELVPESQTEKYFTEQMDDQRTKAWASQGGLGLGDIIYQQLLDKYGQGLGIKSPENRPKGALPLNPTGSSQPPNPGQQTSTKKWEG